MILNGTSTPSARKSGGSQAASPIQSSSGATETRKAGPVELPRFQTGYEPDPDVAAGGIRQDLTLEIGQPSWVGGVLRSLWGAHTLFRVKQTRVDIDDYLPGRLAAFGRREMDPFTRLKQGILFRPGTVRAIHGQMARDTKAESRLTEQELVARLPVHSEQVNNKCNLIITGEGITIAHVSPGWKVADWVLTKHVLVANYSDDVRFAGELWKDEKGIVWVSNNSGTYTPTEEELLATVEYLRAICPNLDIRAKARE